MSYIRYILIGVSTFGLMACSHNEEPKQLMPHQFLTQLPTDTLGFYALKPKVGISATTASGKEQSPFEAISKHIKRFRPDININEFIPQEFSTLKPKFILVAVRGTSTLPEPIVAAELAENNACTLKDALSKNLVKNGVQQIDEQTFKNKDGITFALSCRENFLSFGLSKQASDSVIAPVTIPAAHAPSTLLTAVSSDVITFKDEDQIAVGVLGATGVIEALRSLHPDGDMPALDSLPLTSASLIQKAIKHNDKFEHLLSAVLNITPKNDEQKKHFDEIAQSTSTTHYTLGGSVFQISLNNALTGALVDGGLASMDEEQRAALPSVDLFKGISRLSFGVIGATAENFPSLYIEVEHKDAKGFKELLHDELKTSLASQMPSDQWKQKDIGGNSVSYLTSPFGVGAYLSTKNDSSHSSVVLTSSEDAMKKILTSPSESASSPTGVVGYGTFDCAEFGKTLESLQSSLSMFTGGEQFLSNEELVTLKSLGKAEGSVTVKPQAIEITYRIADFPA